MSRERYNWWPFALNMIRDFPGRKLQTKEGTMGPQAQKEFDAVRRACEMTSIMPMGKVRLRVVQLTEWKKECYLAGAAERLHISFRAAKRYRWQFILLVGYQYGLIDREEYYRVFKADNPSGENRTAK